MTASGSSKWSHALQRIRRAQAKHGIAAGVSEALYIGARATAAGRENSAFVDTQRLKSELTSTKQKLARLKANSAEKLDKERRRTKTLRDKLERSKAKVAHLKKKSDWILRGDLAFHSLQELAGQQCPACDGKGPLVSAYPYAQSEAFSRTLTCWCPRCGFGWVPGLPFELAGYYQNEYAETNRHDRELAPEQYFALLEGPLEEMPGTFARYSARAKEQLSKLETLVPAEYSLLDYGSGPGYALHFSKAKVKHAIEPDGHSTKYLDHIQARRTQPADLLPESYDAILSSHSLEHLQAHQLYPTLRLLRDALKPNGIFFCEVPNGSLLEVHRARRHEPHTLFFNAAALRMIFVRSGFEVLEQWGREPLATPWLAAPLCPDSGTGLCDGLSLIARKISPTPEQPVISDHPPIVAHPRRDGEN